MSFLNPYLSCKMKFKFIIPFIFCQLIFTSSYSQLHAGFYIYPTLEIGGPVIKNFDLQGKYFFPHRYNESDIEISILWLFIQGKSFRMGAGAGVTMDSVNSSFTAWPVFPIQLEFIPLRSFRKVALVIETTAGLNFPRSIFEIRLLLGARYYFREPIIKKRK